MQKNLKTILLLIALFSGNIYASDDHEGSESNSGAAASTSSSNATATQQVGVTNSAAGGQASAVGGASSSSSTNNIYNNARGVEQAPSVYAPNLSTTLTETCMGSTSAGAGWFGFGGTFGSTWSDNTCVRRLDARQMAALGEVAIAKELMCQSDEVREAAKRAGKPCKGDE